MTDNRTVTWHHASVVVSSLERSIDFYCSNFGGVVELLIRDCGGTELAQLHDVADAEYDIAYLRFGDARFELIQFHIDRVDSPSTRQADQLGSSHVAFEVSNILELFEQLTAEGIVFTRAPLFLTEGPASGYAFAFLFDPDGNRVELIQVP